MLKRVLTQVYTTVPTKDGFLCVPIQRLPLECSRDHKCSRECPRECTRSGLVICHLVCFHLLCSLPLKSQFLLFFFSARAWPHNLCVLLTAFFAGTGHLRKSTNCQWEMNLRTGTVWRAFFQLFFLFGPRGPYDCSRKNN